MLAMEVAMVSSCITCKLYSDMIVTLHLQYTNIIFLFHLFLPFFNFFFLTNRLLMVIP